MEMTVIIRAIKSSNARVSCSEDTLHMAKLWWSFSPGTWTSRLFVSPAPWLLIHIPKPSFSISKEEERGLMVVGAGCLVEKLSF